MTSNFRLSMEWGLGTVNRNFVVVNCNYYYYYLLIKRGDVFSGVLGFSQ